MSLRDRIDRLDRLLLRTTAVDEIRFLEHQAAWEAREALQLRNFSEAVKRACQRQRGEPVDSTPLPPLPPYPTVPPGYAEWRARIDSAKRPATPAQLEAFGRRLAAVIAS